MLVSTENLQSVLSDLLSAKELSVDTETTGLYSFKDDHLFSIIISSVTDNYYFNFQNYDYENVLGLEKHLVYPLLKKVFDDPDKIWFMQNAKFDMHMLARDGFYVAGKIYDLMSLDRIHFNQHMSYRLAEITKRWGDHKDDGVWTYIQENKLITKIDHPEYRKTEEKPHFDKVPLMIMQPYGEQDGAGTLNVGKKILNAILKEDSERVDPSIPPQMQVVENEARFNHTLFHMEQRGIKLDIPYCKSALSYYLGVIDGTMARFKELTGVDFVKGTTVFEEVFASEKDKWEKTEKGNYKWDAETLSAFENPAAKVALEYAEAKKQSEYFANFLYYADPNGVLHSDFQPSGTVTGRLSSRDPNLQNLTSPDKYENGTSEGEAFSVRRSFVPREGFFFAMPDYSQVEFRVLLDMAKANGLINEVLNGHDVHTATANVSGTSRKEAKTNNFLTAYGGGVVKLAQNLYNPKGSKAQLGAIYKQMFKWRLSDAEQTAIPTLTVELRSHNEPLIRKAYEIQQSIFRSAPEIKDLLKAVQRTAEQRGYVRNWLGRRYYFTDKRWAYKAPNHIIQGGSAEVIKIAMNRVHDYLKDKESKILLTIHDELIIEVRFGEEYVVDEIKKIMESVYPYKRLPLLVDVEYSYTNLADKAAWPPEHLINGSETGNTVQKESQGTSRPDSQLVV